MKNVTKIKSKVILMMTVVLLAFGSFIIVIFYSLYNTSERNIINMWRNNSILASQEIGYFVADSTDALDFTAKQLNRMTVEGAKKSMIHAYLKEESAIYPDAVAGNSNGVYAYYKGTFMDGSGWNPDKSFSPTERSWYKAAVRAGGAITMVPPYVDSHTGKLITTASKLLDDGESVVGMDIELASVKDMTIAACAGEKGSIAMILTTDGYMVARSDKDAVGYNCKKNAPQLWNKLAPALANSRQRSVTFHSKYNNTSYIVFAEKVNDSWISCLLLNEREAFKSLRYIYIASGLALVAAMSIIMMIFLYIIRKVAQADRLKHLSETDRLTGINNRGAGEAKIRELIELREGGMFIMMDADHFKTINDNYGHDVGDKVIIAIADSLKASFRDSDIILRLGGDEFSVFVKGVESKELGTKVVDRLFKNIDSINIPELGERKIHISVGASFYHSDDRRFEDIYKAADECTYGSKKINGNALTFEKT